MGQCQQLRKRDGTEGALKRAERAHANHQASSKRGCYELYRKNGRPSTPTRLGNPMFMPYIQLSSADPLTFTPPHHRAWLILCTWHALESSTFWALSDPSPLYLFHAISQQHEYSHAVPRKAPGQVCVLTRPDGWQLSWASGDECGLKAVTEMKNRRQPHAMRQNQEKQSKSPGTGTPWLSGG